MSFTWRLSPSLQGSPHCPFPPSYSTVPLRYSNSSSDLSSVSTSLFSPFLFPLQPTFNLRFRRQVTQSSLGWCSNTPTPLSLSTFSPQPSSVNRPVSSMPSRRSKNSKSARKRRSDDNDKEAGGRDVTAGVDGGGCHGGREKRIRHGYGA